VSNPLPLIDTTSERASFPQEIPNLGFNKLPKAVYLKPPCLKEKPWWHEYGALSTIQEKRVMV
jgi:hypothetical protein